MNNNNEKPIIKRSKLDEWINSYSGFHGGNLNAPIWFFGAEFGDIEGNITIPDIEDIGFQELRYWSRKFHEERNGSATSWKFDQKLAWIILYYLNESINNELKKEEIDNYILSEMNTKEGITLRGNLYPMAIHDMNHEWPEKCIYQGKESTYSKVLGFNTPAEYRSYCKKIRANFICKLIYKYRPRIVIGFTKSLWDDFLLAFGVSKIENYNSIKLDGKSEIRCYVNDNGITNIILSPSMYGSNGLNSYKKCNDLAKVMRTMYNMKNEI